jgi:uncharacterized protein
MSRLPKKFVLFLFSWRCLVSVIFTLLILHGLIPDVFAQYKKHAIKVQASATDRSIRLRWAPNTAIVWQLGNRYGYTIERSLLKENEKIVDKPVTITLNRTPFKPAPEAYWEPSIDNDDYVAIAAQAIFGKDFETEAFSSDVVRIISKSKEMELRFSFALFSADHSLNAADLSGLFFEDEQVAPASKYLYRIYANIPADIIEVDTGFVYVGLEDHMPLPRPVGLTAAFGDRVVVLSWNGGLHEKIYNSFWVERSVGDVDSFQRINEHPVVNSFSGEKRATNLVIRTDSLSSNDLRYYYRVIGITAFGETGPSSDTVSGSGKPDFNHAASITSHEFTPEGKVTIKFEFDSEKNALLKSFSLLKLEPSTGTYIELQKNVNRMIREVTDDTPATANYYLIRAIDIYGRTTDSFPHFVQAIDSIPPLPPAELVGTIDTLGRVFLRWKANSDADLQGYAVYRANFETDEFIQIPGPILSHNSFVDTIRLDNLTEEIYYKVVAFDKRFNRSSFSATTALKKPDLIPPVPPVLDFIKMDSGCIAISWIPRGSEDVIAHLLYRREENETDWTLINVYAKDDTASVFRDYSVRHKFRYGYTMLALDDDSLESVPAQPLEMVYISSEPYPRVEKIFYNINKSHKAINVSWIYDHPHIDRFLVYKANDKQPLRLYKSLPPHIREINDTYGIHDRNIEYRIVAGFQSGEKTGFSEPVVVKL